MYKYDTKYDIKTYIRHNACHSILNIPCKLMHIIEKKFVLFGIHECVNIYTLHSGMTGS